MLLRDSGSNRQHAIASVTYRSEAIQPPSPGALVELLKSARLRNQAAGITGMLMYEDGRFFQTLEGPPDSLQKIWCSIQQDPRHRLIEVLGQRIVPARMFSEWNMQFISRENDRRQPARHVRPLEVAELAASASSVGADYARTSAAGAVTNFMHLVQDKALCNFIH